MMQNHTRETLQELSEGAFLEVYEEALSRMSYYNAAEGSNYSEEAPQRNEARTYLNMVTAIANIRNIERPEGNWLA